MGKWYCSGDRNTSTRVLSTTGSQRCSRNASACHSSKHAESHGAVRSARKFVANKLARAHGQCPELEQWTVQE